MKYRWAINKFIEGVPMKVNESKIEITLEILGLGDQLDIYGNKLNDLILNLTPENMTQHSRIE